MIFSKTSPPRFAPRNGRPKDDDPFTQGRRAWGEGPKENPYPEETEAHLQWEAGYRR